MFKQLKNAWRNNNGTILFVCSVAVAFVMSILWRFDMIPDIGPSLRASPMLNSGGLKALPNIVVVSISSANPPTADVIMQVFSESDLDSESLSPLESHSATMQDGLSEFLITSLSRGTYVGRAYIDTNSNGQLDLADDSSPVEPFGFVKVKLQDEPKSLAEAVFEVTADPTFVKIRLGLPKNSVTRSSAGVNQ